jgi:cob(I)alamin adenosyltransferase
MPTKIYTRTGDDGTTGLFGGPRVRKNDARIDAYGTVDETNAAVGLARAYLQDERARDRLDPVLVSIQHDLFVVGADLASPSSTPATPPRIDAEHVRRLERYIDEFDGELPPLAVFILPGGTRTASALHLARTICRRAERLTVAASNDFDLNDNAIAYLNRLSDLFFVLARWANQAAHVTESPWRPVR